MVSASNGPVSILRKIKHKNSFIRSLKFIEMIVNWNEIFEINSGMINTFNLISLFGTGDARVLSSGISEALVTTEFGLIVAIPALIVHTMLSRKISTILGDMEKYAVIFSNGLSVSPIEPSTS